MSLHPFTLLTFLFLVFSCSEKTSCKTFKNGKFYNYSPSTGAKITIDRNDSIQVEINTVTGETVTNLITWTNDCEYTMIEIKTNKASLDGVDSFFARTPIKVSIISTGADYYVYEIQVDSVDKHLEHIDTIRVDKQ